MFFLQTTIPGESELLKQGVLGIFCLLLIAVVIVFWRIIQKSNDKTHAHLKAEVESHKKRITDLETKLEKYITDDRETLGEMLGECRDAIRNNTRVMEQVGKKLP